MRRVLMSVLMVGGLLAGPPLFVGCGEPTQSAEESAARDVEVEALRAKTERLQQEVTLHERREKHAAGVAERAREALEEATREPEPPVEEAPVEEAAQPDTWQKRLEAYPAYEFEAYDEALSGVDWETVGTNMAAMPPLIATLASAIAEGRPLEELDPSLIGDISRYNAPLITAAMGIKQKGMPGADVNGAFSHPAFMVNAMAATLEAVELPLSEEQAASLGELTRDFARREDERIARLDEKASVLEKLLGESDLKRAYFEGAHALLTDEQHAALRPEATRGRLRLDIFCESLMWTVRAGPLVFTDRDDLSAKIGDWITDRAGLQSQDGAEVRAIVDEWVTGLPDDLLGWEVDKLSESGMMQVDHVAESGQAVVRLQTALIEGLALDDAAAARARLVPGTVVPYLRRPE